MGVEEGEYYVDFFKPNPAEQYEFTLPRVGRDDDAALDSDVVKLDGNNNGKSECTEVKEGYKKLTNAGYILRTEEPTFSPTFAPSSSPSKGSGDGKGDAPTPETIPRFCASITEARDEKCPGGATPDADGMCFDYRGCSLPCDTASCPDGMLCAFTTDCP